MTTRPASMPASMPAALAPFVVVGARTPTGAPPAAPTRRAARETDVALEAYRAYEALGPERSFPALVARIRADNPDRWASTDATLLRRVKQWSHDHGWRERVRAYDAEQDRKRREAAEKALARMNEEQARLAAAAQIKLLTGINDMLDIDQGVINGIKAVQTLIAQGQPVPPTLEAYAAMGIKRPRLLMSGATRAELWRSMIDVERLARGAATEIAQQQFAGGIRIAVTTATPDGAEMPSPFGFDPNLLLHLDVTGAVGQDEEEEETVDADAPDASDGPEPSEEP